jgi:hypothetical protein
MLAALDPRVWLILAMAILASAGLGYLEGHRRASTACKIAEAKREATTTAISTGSQAAANASDSATTNRLQATVTKLKADKASLQAQIEELRNARPASPDCRLPDGLRDAINRSLDPEGAR